MSRSIGEAGVLAWVNDVLQRFRTASLPLEVVYADQRLSARPRLPYASVLKISETDLGEGERAYLEETATTATESLGNIIEGTFSVSVYGDEHTTYARSLVRSIRSDLVIDANIARGITIVDVIADLRRLSTNTNNVTEDRSVFDVRARFYDTFETGGVGIIENLVLTSNL